MTGQTPQTPAPAVSDLPIPQPGRAADPAPGARDADRAPGAGTSGGDARARWKAALAAHNAAKRRGRFTRAPKRTSPGMIRKPPPGPPDDAA